MRLHAAALGFAVAAVAAGPTPDTAGSWARSAVSIWAGRAFDIPSPDGAKAIVLRPPRDPDGEENHVPNHSNCREMGTFRAFELALPSGRVLAEHGQATARRTFRDDLGDALRAGGER